MGILIPTTSGQLAFGAPLMPSQALSNPFDDDIAHSGIMWVRPTAVAGNLKFLNAEHAGGNLMNVEVLSNDNLRVRYRDGTTNLTCSLADAYLPGANRWYLIVWVYDPTGPTLTAWAVNEIDGIASIITATDTDAAFAMPSITALRLGASSSGNNAMPCQMAPCMIVAGLLDADDVTAIFQNGAPHLLSAISQGIVGEDDILWMAPIGPRTDGDAAVALIGDDVTIGNFHRYVRGGNSGAVTDWRLYWSADANLSSASGGANACTYIDLLDTAQAYGQLFQRQAQSRTEQSVARSAPRLRSIARGSPSGVLRLGIFNFSDCASRDDADFRTPAGNVWNGLIGATLPSGDPFVSLVAGIDNIAYTDTRVRQHGVNAEDVPWTQGSPQGLNAKRRGWQAWSLNGEYGSWLSHNDGLSLLCEPITGSQLLATDPLRWRLIYLEAPYFTEGTAVNLKYRGRHSADQSTLGTLLAESTVDANSAHASHTWAAGDTYDDATRTIVLSGVTNLALVAGVDYVHLNNGTDNEAELYKITSVTVTANTTIVLEHDFTTTPAIGNNLYFGPARRRVLEGDVAADTSTFRGPHTVCDAATGGHIVVISSGYRNPDATSAVIVSGHGDGGVVWDKVFEGAGDTFDISLDANGAGTFFQELDLDVALVYPGIDNGEANQGDGTQVHLIDDAIALAMPNCERVWICRQDGIRQGVQQSDDFSVPNQYASDNANAAGVPFLAFAQTAPIGIGEENLIRGFISDLRHPSYLGAQHFMTAMLAEATVNALSGGSMATRHRIGLLHTPAAIMHHP